MWLMLCNCLMPSPFLTLVATECRDHHRLISPKVFETRWREFRISHRMLNIFVAEIRLQCARVVAPIRQCITARMAQHVRVHTELELSLDAQPRDHLGEARAGERCAPLRHEHERRLAL